MTAAPRPVGPASPPPASRGSTVCDTEHCDIERERRWTGKCFELVIVAYTFLVKSTPAERDKFTMFEQRMNGLAAQLAEDGQIVMGLVCHKRSGKEPWAEFKVRTLNYDLPTTKPRR